MNMTAYFKYINETQPLNFIEAAGMIRNGEHL